MFVGCLELGLLRLGRLIASLSPKWIRRRISWIAKYVTRNI